MIAGPLKVLIIDESHLHSMALQFYSNPWLQFSIDNIYILKCALVNWLQWYKLH